MKSAVIPKTTLTADETAAKPSSFTWGEVRFENVVNGKAAQMTLAQSAGFIAADDIKVRHKKFEGMVRYAAQKTAGFSLPYSCTQ